MASIKYLSLKIVFFFMIRSFAIILICSIDFVSLLFLKKFIFVFEDEHSCTIKDTVFSSFRSECYILLP